MLKYIVQEQVVLIALKSTKSGKQAQIVAKQTGNGGEWTKHSSPLSFESLFDSCITEI